MGMAGMKGGHAHPLCIHFSWISTRKLCWKFHSKIFTGFKVTKHHFFKNCPKKVTKVENFNFFFIFGNNFIGLSNGILHVLMLSEVLDKLKETSVNPILLGGGALCPPQCSESCVALWRMLQNCCHSMTLFHATLARVCLSHFFDLFFKILGN